MDKINLNVYKIEINKKDDNNLVGSVHIYFRNKSQSEKVLDTIINLECLLNIHFSFYRDFFKMVKVGGKNDYHLGIYQSTYKNLLNYFNFIEEIND